MNRIDDIGGEIRVRLAAHGGRIGTVEIVSTRPREAARIFEGQSTDRMCASIGRVFSLCGRAQTIAALGAVEQALAITPDPAVSAARHALRRAEILTQVVTRLALHWPRVLGVAFSADAVRAAMAAERAIEAAVLGADWRRPGAGIAGQTDGIVLPEIDVARLTDPLAAALAARGCEAYGALPNGMSPEFGVLGANWDSPEVAHARHAHGAGLVARLAAARVALHSLPGKIRDDLGAVRPCPARRASRNSGQGTATVNTARGPLTHRVRVEGGIVTRCRTDAPTDANFAPGGAVAAGLMGALADPVAAELHVLAIDPCVASVVELVPSGGDHENQRGREVRDPDRGGE